MENYPEDVAPDVFQMQHTDPLGANDLSSDPRADSPALQPVPDQVSSAPIEADSPASDGPSTHGGSPLGLHRHLRRKSRRRHLITADFRTHKDLVHLHNPLQREQLKHLLLIIVHAQHPAL